MSDNYLTHIFEAMNALVVANDMPGLKNNRDQESVYIINYMQNNAFAQALTTDYKLRNAIIRDPEDKKLKFTSVDNQDQYGFDNTTDIKGMYHVMDKANLSEGLEKIKSNIGKEVPEGFIYECILGDKMYSFDQIDFTDKVEKVTPFNDALAAMNESIRNYCLYGKEQAELIAEIKYGTNTMSELLQESFNEGQIESIKESEDKSKLTKNYKKDPVPYRAIDIYDDECYKYFDKKEIDWYRKDKRQGEILVETERHSAIGYIYVKDREKQGIVVGPFKVFDYYKGMGFGEVLLKDAIKKYKANYLGVFVDNKVAIKLYEKVGFKIVETKVDKDGEKYYVMKL